MARAAAQGRAETKTEPAAHTHGLVPDAVKRSREGLRAVGASLGILGVTAAIQGVIYVLTDSVALLADLIHNAGDALTALPLGLAFFLGSDRVVGIQRSTAERGGERLDVGDCIVFQLKDGRVTDGREHFHDLYAWDEFWS